MGKARFLINNISGVFVMWNVHVAAGIYSRGGFINKAGRVAFESHFHLTYAYSKRFTSK